jgi:endonuclease YncB( thermonuclease family)
MAKRRETVTKVIDGDTFETASRKHPIRLANVDAPEKRQRGYQEAKKALKQQIEGAKVEVTTVARDPYGRAVANVKVGGKSVNAAMRRKTKR